ncbi:hypothetical protein LTR95_011210 [Oleoguttula sp. CCFEE 5521]
MSAPTLSGPDTSSFDTWLCYQGYQAGKAKTSDQKQIRSQGTTLVKDGLVYKWTIDAIYKPQGKDVFAKADDIEELL